MTVIGTVSTDAFDRGVALSLDPETFSVPVDKDEFGNPVYQAVWGLRVPDVYSGIPGMEEFVPLYHVNPEDVYSPAYLPSVRISQPDMTPAFDRQPWWELVGRAPAAGATEVVLPNGERGWTQYESQWRATPFDMTYDITIVGRRREDANRIRLYVLRHCKPPWWNIPVTDSLGDVRHYDAGDMSVSDISEIVDIADRLIGWTVSFTVRAEIDLDDPMIGTRAFTGASALDPSDPLYSRFDIILRTHVGIDPAAW